MPVKNWFGVHNLSTWMIVVAVVIMAGIAHNGLLGYLMVALMAGWLIITREVARREGITRPMCKPCLLAGAGIILVALVIVLKINWLAL